MLGTGRAAARSRDPIASSRDGRRHDLAAGGAVTDFCSRSRCSHPATGASALALPTARKVAG
jgi:hypothetical protein